MAQAEYLTSQIAVNEPQAHTTFLCLIFSLKEKEENSHRRRNRMKDPCGWLLPRDTVSILLPETLTIPKSV